MKSSRQSTIERRISFLSPAKRTLFQRILRDKGISITPTQAALLRENRETGPVSFAQQRLWFLQQLDPTSNLYNVPIAFRLQGDLNKTALTQSLQEIMRRHEVLRTTFSMQNGIPIQVIHHATPFTLRTIDLRCYPEHTREWEAKKLLNQESAMSFDLSQGPLVRVSLIELSDRTYILCLIAHHIVFDAWSSGIFLKELSVVYGAFSNNTQLSLNALPIQYADFAVWQRHLMQGEAMQEQLTYWKKHLEGAPPICELPSDRLRPPLQTFCGARQLTKLPQSLSKDLRELSNREEATLFMTLLATFKILLYRYTGNPDIIIGSPVANRTTVESESLIGFFVNNLVIRTNCSGNPSFRELLKRVRQTTREALNHQDLPFEKLVEEIRPERTLTHSPIFQIMFAFQNVPKSPISLPSLDISRIDVNNDTAKFDLILFMDDTEDGLRGTLEFNTDLFEEQTAARLLAHYQNLLSSIVVNPLRRIEELDMLTESELQTLKTEWNDTKSDYPHHTCIHEIFESQAKKSPEAVAAVYEREYRYHELNRSANQVARSLRDLGIGPNTLVGICMERTSWLIIGMIGILKAGGAYVPLDPTHPKDRLATMAEDAGLSIILAVSSVNKRLDNLKTKVLYLDEYLPILTPGRDGNLENINSPEDLAYVIYTSGSTGTPKGVTISHRAVMRLVCKTNYIQISPADRIAQVSNISFDASTFEIWGALLNGAGSVQIDRDVLIIPQELARALREKQITIMFLTTALFNLIARNAPHILESLHTVLFGGEAVDAECVRLVLRHGPPTRLIHVYGPTENTTFSTWHEIQSINDESVRIPIGKPVANTTCYVLSRMHALVPVGGIGELFLGGDGLSNGYLRSPDLNKSKFIPDPFSVSPHDRLYKTGDLVRTRSDGNLEFVGRIDKQIKIRGYRVEPSEIEAALRKFQGIRNAAVVSRKDDTGNNCLVAHIELTQGSPFHKDHIREFLRTKLPSFMIPSAFIPADSIPLTANGKIDYASIPEPMQKEEQETLPSLNPSKMEQLLTRIWEDLLKIHPIAPTENFFDLGGHSLMIICVFVQIERELGIKIPPSVLFQAPTIEQLALFISTYQQSASECSLVPIRSAGSKPPLICIPPIRGSVLLYQHLAKYLDPDYSVYGLEGSDGTLDFSLKETAAQYIIEMRKKIPGGPFLLIGFSSGGYIAFEMARQLRMMNLEVSLLAILDTACIGYAKEKTQQWKPDLIGKFLQNFPFWLYYYLPFWVNYYWNVAAKSLKKAFLLRGRKIHAALEEEADRSYEVINWLSTYSLQKYPGPITFYRAKAQGLFPSYPDKGWGNFADYVNIVTIPGNHISIVKEPHVRVLADKINNELRNIESS
jgi:amino acid adenylation domain-containing protein